MKKDYVLYVISRVVKGRRDYMVDGLRTYSDNITSAKFFENKKEAEQRLQAEVAHDLLTKRQMEWNGRKIGSFPTYELLSVTMKINKEPSLK